MSGASIVSDNLRGFADGLSVLSKVGGRQCARCKDTQKVKRGALEENFAFAIDGMKGSGLSSSMVSDMVKGLDCACAWIQHLFSGSWPVCRDTSVQATGGIHFPNWAGASFMKDGAAIGEVGRAWYRKGIFSLLLAFVWGLPHIPGDAGDPRRVGGGLPSNVLRLTSMLILTRVAIAARRGHAVKVSFSLRACATVRAGRHLARPQMHVPPPPCTQHSRRALQKI